MARWGIAIGLMLVVLVTSEPISQLIYCRRLRIPTWIMFPLLFRASACRIRRDWW